MDYDAIVHELRKRPSEERQYDMDGILFLGNVRSLSHKAADAIEQLQKTLNNHLESESAETMRANRATVDAKRWQCLVRTASLGFDAAPSWNAVMRFPVFDHTDDTITKLVDRLIKREGGG